MGLFKHPCLVRGTVHTPFGAFTIVRGIADLPDDIGEALGWPRLNEEPVVPSSAAASGTIGNGRPDHIDSKSIR